MASRGIKPTKLLERLKRARPSGSPDRTPLDRLLEAVTEFQAATGDEVRLKIRPGRKDGRKR